MALVAVDARILQDARYTGVSYYLLNILRAWQKNDRSRDFCLYFNQFQNLMLNDELKKYEFRHFRLPNKMLNLSLLLLKRPKFCKYIPEEILWLPNLNYYNWPLTQKLVLSVHDLSFVHFPEFFSLKRRLYHGLIGFAELVKRADSIITDSAFTKNDILITYGVKEQKVSVVPLGIDERYFTLSKSDSDDDYNLSKGQSLPDTFIAYLGTIEPRKNLISLISAFNELAKKSKELHLVLVGPVGWLAKGIFHALARSPYSSRVHYLGYLSFTDKIKILKRAKVFVFPSFYEGFGLPPLEAMACGCPVVASSVGSLPEVLGDAALFVNPFETQELSQAIWEVLKNDKLREALKKAGSIKASQYSWADTAQKTFDILTK